MPAWLVQGVRRYNSWSLHAKYWASIFVLIFLSFSVTGLVTNIYLKMRWLQHFKICQIVKGHECHNSIRFGSAQTLTQLISLIKVQICVTLTTVAHRAIITSSPIPLGRKRAYVQFLSFLPVAKFDAQMWQFIKSKSTSILVSAVRRAKISSNSTPGGRMRLHVYVCNFWNFPYTIEICQL